MIPRQYLNYDVAWSWRPVCMAMECQMEAGECWVAVDILEGLQLV